VAGSLTNDMGQRHYAVLKVQQNLAGLPQIIQQPQSATVVDGTNVSFSVTALGEPPLHFQWYYYSTAIGGATNSTFHLPFVDITNAGPYKVVVSNAVGSVEVLPVDLRVLHGPRPVLKNEFAYIGTDLIWKPFIYSGDSPMDFRWFFEGAPLPHETNVWLILTNIQPSQAGLYTLQASNVHAVRTASALLHVSDQVQHNWTQSTYIDDTPGPRLLKLDTNNNVCVAGPGFRLAKYSSTGERLWGRGLPGKPWDRCFGLILDTDQNVLVGVTAATETNGNNLVLAKYSPTGQPLWRSSYDTVGSAYGVSMDLDDQGNLVVAGVITGLGRSSPTFLLKFDSSGRLVWIVDVMDRQLSGLPFGLCVDERRNIFVAQDGPTILKYDPSGNLLWGVTNNLSLGWTTSPLVIALHQQTNVVLAATRYNDSSRQSDLHIFCYAGTGELLWTRAYSGPQNMAEVAAAIAVDAGGNLLIAASVFQSFDRSWPGGNPPPRSHTSLLLKYDSAGNHLWTARLFPTWHSVDEGVHLSVDDESNACLAAGRSIAKFDRLGNRLWAFPSPMSTESLGNRVANDLEVDPSGNVFVVWSRDDFTMLSHYTVAASAGLPQLRDHPASRTAPFGMSQLFTGVAVGEQPLSYRWLSNGIPVLSETNTSLLRTNLQTGDFANYSLQASNRAGIVVSPEFALTSPANFSFADVTNDSVAFRFTGQHSRSYTFEQSSDLTHWTVITNVVAYDTNRIVFPKTPSPGFYRAFTHP
jgi:outer membrane protein assembly factor BamB